MHSSVKTRRANAGADAGAGEGCRIVTAPSDRLAARKFPRLVSTTEAVIVADENGDWSTYSSKPWSQPTVHEGNGKPV